MIKDSYEAFLARKRIIDKEAIQVAAVACRLAIACDNKAFQQRSGFLTPNPGPPCSS